MRLHSLFIFLFPILAISDKNKIKPENFMEFYPTTLEEERVNSICPIFSYFKPPPT